jgi:hypothetical protein
MNLILSEKWSRINGGEYLCTSSSNCFPIDNLKFDLESLEKKFIEFGIVKQNTDSSLLITDRFNTVPIYFAWLNENLIITDTLVEILKKSQWKFDNESVLEHLLYDFTFTPLRTLYKDIYKVPSGTILKVYSNGRIQIIDQLINRVPGKCEKLSREDFYEKTLAIKHRILEYIKPHDSYYIPVSGGLDSRIILGIVAGYTNANIYSRTYGDNKSLDVINGNRVARKLNILHDIVSKPDNLALVEFERTVLKSGGELNGVHGHDLEGRDKFENGPYRSKISGFIGDLLARGANLKNIINSKDEVITKFLQVRTNFNNYDYKKLYSSSTDNLTKLIEDNVKDYVASVYNIYGNYESLTWDYYVTKRVGCMTSLLEYFTHVKKPNYKPFLIPEFMNFVTSNAGYDKWDGMGYSRIAKILIPDLMEIPLSSNNIFTSKTEMFKFKLEKRIANKRNEFLSRFSKGNILPLAHNATLNWRAIIKQNPEWVKIHTTAASSAFQLNQRYIEDIYNDHCNGRLAHEEFLLRVISLGIIARSR